ncbi:hypothetical protein FQN55_009431 [Onygenales sp. PD_40]|nr:hypothetical protein FQN55_009431 [Onygenales sp. PD_40]
MSDLEQKRRDTPSMMELTISRLKSAVPLLLRKAKKQLAALKSKKSSHTQQPQEQDGVPENSQEPLEDNKDGLEDLKNASEGETKWEVEQEKAIDWPGYEPFLPRLELKRHFDSSKFADLTIKTSEKEFKVHKIVLSCQSEYFARMLGGEWKETVNNLVILEEEDPKVIETMIRFMYEYDYQDDDETTQGVVFHAMVYAAGEKYGIAPLKTHAASKFKGTFVRCFYEIDLPLVIAAVYTTTVSTDSELRDCFGRVINCHIEELMEDETFIEMLEQYPTFSVDTLKSMTFKSPKYYWSYPNYYPQWSEPSPADDGDWGA